MAKEDMFEFEDDTPTKKEATEETDEEENLLFSRFKIVARYNKAFEGKKKAYKDQPTKEYLTFYLKKCSNSELNVFQYQWLSEANKKIFDELTRDRSPKLPEPEKVDVIEPKEITYKTIEIDTALSHIDYLYKLNGKMYELITKNKVEFQFDDPDLIILKEIDTLLKEVGR